MSATTRVEADGNAAAAITQTLRSLGENLSFLRSSVSGECEVLRTGLCNWQLSLRVQTQGQRTTSLLLLHARVDALTTTPLVPWLPNTILITSAEPTASSSAPHAIDPREIAVPRTMNDAEVYHYASHITAHMCTWKTILI